MFIHEIKSIISLKEKIEVEKLILIHSGNILKDEKTIEYYKINKESVISVIIKLLDENEKLAIEFKQCDQVLLDGLSVKVRCTLFQCQAFGQYILQNLGYVSFDFTQDKEKIKCSFCESQIYDQSMECSLRNCRFFATGVYEISNNKLKKFSWKNNYFAIHDYQIIKPFQSFVPDTMPLAQNFVSFKIHCYRLDANERKIKLKKRNFCYICLEFIQNVEIADDCGHCVHQQCYEQFEFKKCPICN